MILHLYDPSASDKQPLNTWAPIPCNAGKIAVRAEPAGFFSGCRRLSGRVVLFSLVDPAAPTLIQRAQDMTGIPGPAGVCSDAIRPCRVSPADQPDQPPLLHRRITPNSLRVRHNNRPLFTDFSLSRLTGCVEYFLRSGGFRGRRRMSPRNC
ncbi:MAG: hypothetical protein IPL99_26320 [Candidatus Competibacteraceae bacterium]|nr:hypothetical protein [Candidatus Competibacteraceae bacterium]